MQPQELLKEVASTKSSPKTKIGIHSKHISIFGYENRNEIFNQILLLVEKEPAYPFFGLKLINFKFLNHFQWVKPVQETLLCVIKKNRKKSTKPLR